MDQSEYSSLLTRAFEIAIGSPDPSTQNGAVIAKDGISVRSTGYNRFPTGVTSTPERWEKPLKYQFVEHAERNAIYRCAKLGRCTEGAVMACCWAACPPCARAIIEAGITTLVVHARMIASSSKYWADQMAVANEMLTEAGIVIIQLDNINAPKIRFNGELFTP